MPLSSEQLKELIDRDKSVIDDLIRIFIQAEEIKQTLRNKGFGVTGTPFYDTVMEAISEIEDR